MTLEGLRRGFDAILLTVGELAKGDGEKLGMPLAGAVLKADPSTCRLSPPNVFAAGACVKPVKQLVRAMAEGRAAAECVHRFLRGQPPRRPEKPFSSIMGRLEPGELREFLRTASQERSVTPCDRCAGFNRGEAARKRRAACIATAGPRATVCCSTTPKFMAPTPAGSARSAGPSTSNSSPAASFSSRANAFSAGFASS